MTGVSGHKVYKFGGASLADPDSIATALRLVERGAGRHGVVVVVSAPRGVTDGLISIAERAAQLGAEGVDDLAGSVGLRFRTLARRTIGAGEDLQDFVREADRVVGELRSILRTVAGSGSATPRQLDTVIAAGERLSAPLFAAALRRIGLDAEFVDAGELIVTDPGHGDAVPDLVTSGERIRRVVGSMLDRGCIPVVPGFVGATPCGITTTLGRGGSDFTAAIIAHSLESQGVDFFKEVAGVLTADPDVVDDAQHVASISYSELSELSCFGGKVLQYRASRLLAEGSIPVRIRSAFDPHAEGTAVVRRHAPEEGIVRAVTSISGLGSVRVGGYGASRAPVAAVRELLASGQPAIRISHASAESESSLVVVPADRVDEVAADLGRIGEIDVRRGLAIVSVVGDRIDRDAETTGRLFESIGRSGVAVRAVELGGTGSAIRLVVDETDAARAVRAAHALTESVCAARA